jgi:hypothetical protein
MSVSSFARPGASRAGAKHLVAAAREQGDAVGGNQLLAAIERVAKAEAAARAPREPAIVVLPNEASGTLPPGPHRSKFAPVREPTLRGGVRRSRCRRSSCSAASQEPVSRRYGGINIDGLKRPEITSAAKASAPARADRRDMRHDEGDAEWSRVRGALLDRHPLARELHGEGARFTNYAE